MYVVISPGKKARRVFECVCVCVGSISYTEVKQDFFFLSLSLSLSHKIGRKFFFKKKKKLYFEFASH